MQKTVDYLCDQLKGFHVDNVSIAMIESIKYQYHGQSTPIKHLASITQESRRIQLSIYDPQIADGVVKCLVDSGLEAYKFSKNAVIINIPLPSKEQRDKVAKRLKILCEETKVALRNLRKKAKKHGIEENDLNRITTKYTTMVDDLMN